MDDMISRAAAIECAIDAVDNWDGGYNPNREIYIRRYFEEVPAVDAVPIADVKSLADIAVYVISKMEDFGCAYVWENSGDPVADENNVRAECQEYRRKIKSITEGRT